MADEPIEQNAQPEEQQGQQGESKDRTSEQFDKLKQSNQELKEERDQALAENKEYQSVLDSLMPSSNAMPQAPQPQYQQPINQAPSAQQFNNLNQQQINQTFQSMVDENGYLDGQRLMQTLQAMDQRAQKAEQRAAEVEKRMQQKEENERETTKQTLTQQLHQEFPQLDPNQVEEFNPEFWEAVRNEMLGQLVHKGKEDPIAAARKWYDKFYEDGDSVTKKEKAKQTENQKKQSNAARPRSPMNVGYYAQEEESALVSQVRQGRKGAVAELLRRKGL